MDVVAQLNPTSGPISNEEQLYRSVPSTGGFFKVVDGKVRFSSSAFNDARFSPSVDRAGLRNSPAESKLQESHGITGLKAADARGIRVQVMPEAPTGPEFYAVDVVSRPVLAGNDRGLPENLAHAQIESNPYIVANKRFQKIKEALALEATKYGWVLEP
jgi:hypothetical protein